MADKTKFTIKYCVLFSLVLFLGISFLSKPSLAALSEYDFVKNKPADESIQNLSDIKIPEGFGKVVETYQGTSSRVIVHLQDLHCNYDCQMNIVRILRYLMKTNGLRLVNCEGAAGVLDPTLFTFKDKKMQRKVTKFFLKQGQLTGAEYLLINNEGEYPLELWGVEDEEPYLKHIEIFNKTYPKSKDLKRLCDNIKAALSKVKKTIYPNEVLELDEKHDSYENKDIEVNDFVAYLREKAKERSVDLSKFNNFYMLTELSALEPNIEFAKVDKERAQLIDDLSRALPKEEFSVFFQKSLAYKAGEMTAGEYFSAMKEAANANNIDLAQYTNLKNYIEYTGYSEKISKVLLFSELDGVEDEIRDSYLTTDEQKRLARLSKNVQMLKKFFDMSMSNEEMEYYETHKAEFTSTAFSDFLKEIAPKYNVRYSLDPNISTIDSSRKDEEEFYKLAIVRDEALIRNTLDKMDFNGLNLSALIAGGYHTRGFTEKFREKGISYIVVSPNVTNIDEDLYYSVMTNQEIPVEKLLEEEDGKDDDKVW
jgi:hypothetical protein